MTTDTDLELLEAYLDDVLSDQELAQVALRLSREPALAAELDAIRAERELRKAVWSSLEPKDTEVERLLGRVDEAVRRRRSFERRAEWGKWASVAAACMVFAFTTGWFGRGQVAAPADSAASFGGAVQKATPKQQQDYPVVLTNEAGQTIAVQHFKSIDKAREFVDDMKKWQETQRQVQSGTAVPTGGQF